MCRVHGQRRNHREDQLTKLVVEKLTVFAVKRGVVAEHDPLLSEGRRHLREKPLRHLLVLSVDLVFDRIELLMRSQAIRS